MTDSGPSLYQLSQLITPQPDGELHLHLRAATVTSLSPLTVTLDNVVIPAYVLDGVTVTVGGVVLLLVQANAAPLIVGGASGTVLPAKSKLFASAGGGGTTSGTAQLTVGSVTVPAQGVPGQVWVSVHAYVSFTTTGDGFECFIADSDAPATAVVSARINVPADPHDFNLAPHGVFPADGTDSETYLFRLERTAGSGTATAFNDSRYLRMTALWVPN